MKLRWLGMSCLLLALLLSACQSSEVTDEAEGAYPAPQVGDSYPQPQVVDPYPDAELKQEDALEIEWGDAEDIIMNGAISQITQTHDGVLILKTREGVVFVTQQPEVDEVFKVIERCGDLCADILVATE